MTHEQIKAEHDAAGKAAWAAHAVYEAAYATFKDTQAVAFATGKAAWAAYDAYEDALADDDLTDDAKAAAKAAYEAASAASKDAVAASDAAYAAAKDAAYASLAAYDAWDEVKAKDAAKAEPKGIIWDSEPGPRCFCGNVCTNCGGPGHM